MRLRALAAIALTVPVLATGCGGSSTSDDSPTDASSSAVSSTGSGIRVVFKDGKITPTGERVEVEAGEPIDFVIEADAPGELHFHSTPEHTIDFEAGTTDEQVTIDQPGIVDVELHNTDTLVLQLEVR